MATMLERLREGLIWSYAALSLAEEQRTKGQQWWEQERLRLREEARTRLDDALRQMEERRAQRADWMAQRSGWVKERVRAGLAESGVATNEQLADLQARIDALSAELQDLRARGAAPASATTAEMPPVAPVAPLPTEPGGLTDIPPAP